MLLLVMPVIEMISGSLLFNIDSIFICLVDISSENFKK